MHYDLTPVEARCPACHAERAERLYRVDAAQAAQHYVLREADPDRHAALRAHIAALWGQPTCDVVRCRACGFGFASPYVAGDARFYTLAYERTGYPVWKWEFARTLRALGEADLPPDVSLLEVGAGDGAFLRRVVPGRVAPERALATEFSDYGRRAIEALGVRAVAADVRDLEPASAGAPFDVICLFQVLEHLDRLDALMAHLNTLAAPDGRLFVGVPSAPRVAFNEHNGSLLDMPPNHVGRWTRAAFEALGARHGWRVEAAEVEPEGRASRLRELVTYRYMRRRQDAASLANRVERLPRSAARRGLQAAVAAVYGLGAIPAAVRLARDPGLGVVLWVALRREGGERAPRRG